MDTAIVVLLGTLIPIAAASVFYAEDRRQARADRTVVPASVDQTETTEGFDTETATTGTSTRPELVEVVHSDVPARSRELSTTSGA